MDKGTFFAEIIRPLENVVLFHGPFKEGESLISSKYVFFPSFLFLENTNLASM